MEEEEEEEAEGLALPKPLTVLAPVPELFLGEDFFAWRAVDEEEEEEEEGWGDTGRRKAWRVGKRAAARKRRGTAGWRRGGGRRDGIRFVAVGVFVVGVKAVSCGLKGSGNGA